MADAELFNQPENTNPTMSKRLSFGASGVITENMTLTNFVAWILSKFTNAWHTVGVSDTTLGSGWAQGAEPMQFRLNGWGQLEFRGSLTTAGLASTIVFTLPDGFRPSKAVYKPVIITGADAATFPQIYINTIGEVIIAPTYAGSDYYVNDTFIL